MPKRFEGVDFFAMDALLSDEERRIRDEVRLWVEERVLPVITEAYMTGRFPTELIPEMGTLGLLGANLPKEFGCAGLSNVAYGLIMQELERGDSAVRSFASVQGGLVMFPIHAFGSDEQKTHWLPQLASGSKVGCFGLTEPDHGSNPADMVTAAERTRQGWLLTGRKKWITSGTIADLAVIWAQTEAVGDSRTIRGFLVPTDHPALTTPEQRGKLSLRAADTGEIHLDGVDLPDTALLPKGEGLKSALSCLTQARYGIVWGAIGAAMACFHEAAEYAREREVFGGPLSRKQIQQVRLADMLTGITHAQLMALQLGRLKDGGKATPQQVSMAKRSNVNMACDAAREARRLLGANGILAEKGVMRHMANLESVYTYEGTHDIHSLILGQAVTGESAY